MPPAMLECKVGAGQMPGYGATCGFGGGKGADVADECACKAHCAKFTTQTCDTVWNFQPSNHQCNCEGKEPGRTASIPSWAPDMVYGFASISDKSYGYIVAADQQNCQDACASKGLECDAAAGSQLNTDAKVKEAAAKGGSPCTVMTPHPGGAWQDWNGPWQVDGHRCGWASGAYTMTCQKPGSPGHRRICVCSSL
eukprot:gnl/TRDRNA2_/TRDRNA2_170273_c0_seq1.p1 gnl/TRDRNA2_/TRDRNA2_170273_c0~~gnl/TRDRNA2_/TRDRNA2_170273_c0_seq1.p1  ORF type:complete len:215 (-),score=21.39 gnl/TRDRNA2_/TRDRNA2_170273_c0_seq1:206-793(-)